MDNITGFDTLPMPKRQNKFRGTDFSIFDDNLSKIEDKPKQRRFNSAPRYAPATYGRRPKVIYVNRPIRRARPAGPRLSPAASAEKNFVDSFDRIGNKFSLAKSNAERVINKIKGSHTFKMATNKDYRWGNQQKEQQLKNYRNRMQMYSEKPSERVYDEG